MLVLFTWLLVGSHGGRGGGRDGTGAGGEAGHSKQEHPPDLVGWVARGSSLITPGMVDSGAGNHRLMHCLGMTAWGCGTLAQGSCDQAGEGSLSRKKGTGKGIWLIPVG